MSPQEMTKLVQSELRRVGCLTASADGDWNASSQRSLTLFNKYAGTKLDQAGELRCALQPQIAM
ncbi:hypothetical protein [Bradyrhizobium zhanjiangense]|uniref:hypothetical protein n=1 Tax=Bradyrhizobium zhanjiangense TaxID=1325107 RepID=UPI003B84B710